jgi:hypothetical protein
MARGESGRIVIEVEPEVKRRLYSALALSGSTLKDWFIRTASTFCDESVQPSLFGHGAANGCLPSETVDGASPSARSSEGSGASDRSRRQASKKT